MRYPRVILHGINRPGTREGNGGQFLEVLTRPDDAEAPCEGFPAKVWRWPRNRIRGG